MAKFWSRFVRVPSFLLLEKLEVSKAPQSGRLTELRKPENSLKSVKIVHLKWLDLEIYFFGWRGCSLFLTGCRRGRLSSLYWNSDNYRQQITVQKLPYKLLTAKLDVCTSNEIPSFGTNLIYYCNRPFSSLPRKFRRQHDNTPEKNSWLDKQYTPKTGKVKKHRKSMAWSWRALKSFVAAVLSK